MKSTNSVSKILKNTAIYVLCVGALMIGIGMAIIFKPEIVTILVVSAFVFLGIISIMFGIQILNAYTKISKIIKKLKLD